MKPKLLIYFFPSLLFAYFLYGYDIQDHPNKFDQTSTKEFLQTNRDDIFIPPSSVEGACTYSWSAQTSGTTSQLIAVSAVSSKIGWAAGVGPTVRRTIDGGLTWTAATGTGIFGVVFSIYGVDADIAICTTTPTPAGTFIYKTTNGGTTWTTVFSQAGGFLDGIQMVSPTEGYAIGDPVGGKWTVLKTTNGGTTWTRMATEPTQIGSEFGYNNSFTILGADMWFGTKVGTVYHSSNLGATWSFASTPGAVDVLAVHFNSTGASGLGLAGGQAMLKSINGGITYSATGSPGTALNINGLEGVGNEWWALRNDDSIFYSTNQGTTWTFVYEQDTVLQHIDFVIESGCPVGWVVGNRGRIAKMSPPFTKTLQLTAFIEGYWNCLSYIGDTLTVEIRNATSPYSLVDVAEGKSDGTGDLTVSFTAAITNNTPYYIVVKHRNSIETWSKTGGEMWPTATTTISYDFTTTASQAFGSNQVLKCGEYCIYSGDVNQDGIIEGADLSLIDNDAFNFVQGYVPSDLNCDNIVDGSDAAIADNNAANFVVKITP